PTAEVIGHGLAGGAVAATPEIIGAGKAAIRAIPNAERAGLKFDQVHAAMGDKPVDISAAKPAITRAQELNDAAFFRPKILQRVGQRLEPGQPPVTFRESSDLASNAGGLSAEEHASIRPP